MPLHCIANHWRPLPTYLNLCTGQKKTSTWPVIGAVYKHGQQNAWLWPVLNGSKGTEASFLLFLTIWWHTELAQMPKSHSLATFMPIDDDDNNRWTNPITMYFTPCACMWGNWWSTYSTKPSAQWTTCICCPSLHASYTCSIAVKAATYLLG